MKKPTFALSVAAVLGAAFFSLRAADEGAPWQNWFADGSLQGGQIISGQATYKVENGC